MVKSYITGICFLYFGRLSIASSFEDESKSIRHLQLDGLVRESIQSIRVLTKSNGDKKGRKRVKESKGKKEKVKKDGKKEKSVAVISGGGGFSTTTATEVPSITCDETDDECLTVEATMFALFDDNTATPDERSQRLLRNLATTVNQKLLNETSIVCDPGSGASNEEKEVFGCNNLFASSVNLNSDSATDNILMILYDSKRTLSNEADNEFGALVNMDCWMPFIEQIISVIVTVLSFFYGITWDPYAQETFTTILREMFFTADVTKGLSILQNILTTCLTKETTTFECNPNELAGNILSAIFSYFSLGDIVYALFQSIDVLTFIHAVAMFTIDFLLSSLLLSPALGWIRIFFKLAAGFYAEVKGFYEVIKESSVRCAKEIFPDPTCKDGIVVIEETGTSYEIASGREKDTPGHQNSVVSVDGQQGCMWWGCGAYYTTVVITKFNLDFDQNQIDQNLVNAELKLETRSSTPDAVVLGRMTSPFEDKDTIPRWSDFGGNGPQKVMEISFKPKDEGQVTIVNVESIVRSWVARSEPNYGFLMSTSSTNGFDFLGKAKLSTQYLCNTGHDLNYGHVFMLLNKFSTNRRLSGNRSGNDSVFTKDYLDSSEQTVKKTYQWIIRSEPGTGGVSYLDPKKDICAKYGDMIYIQNTDVNNKWLSGVRTASNEGVVTRDYLDGYEQTVEKTYQWIIIQPEV